MTEERRHICLGFSGELYPEGTHICYLYNDDEERRQVLPDFIRYGLESLESVDYAADVTSRDQLLQVMSDLGVPAQDGVTDDRFHIATALETYCPDGQFKPDEMIERLRQIYLRHHAAGCAGSRATGEMSWAVRGIPGSERLVEYESRINTLVRDVPLTVMCQYDVRRFDGATIYDIINVHPIMIVRGHILRNPFYVPPEQVMEIKNATTGWS
jgi:hypothetical protein